MTQRDMAGYLKIDVKTLRNWRKNKPQLYKTILKGFALQEAVDQSERNYKNLLQISQDLET